MFAFCFIYVLVVLGSLGECQTSCDIVIVGGTLASLGSALHAPDSFRTCLI